MKQPPASISYGATAVMVCAAGLVGLFVAPRWGVAPVDLLFLPAVLAAAALFGRRPAVFAAVLSALAYNYLFVSPVHTFRVDRPDDLVTIAVLLAVALVVSQLAAAMRSQAQLAAAAAARNATIAGLAGKLLSARTVEGIAEVATHELATLFECNATMLAPGGDGFEILAREPVGNPLTPSDVAAAAVALDTGEPAGRGAPRLNPADWLFYPVRREHAGLAAIGLARNDGGRPVDDARRPLLENLLDQVALAMARVVLEREVQNVAGLRERDRLRSALLSSVGHDLRTPLTAIVAAAAELNTRSCPPELVATIETEADTLRRYIDNLLGMARIEAGGVRVHREPIDLVDAVGTAVHDVRARMGGRIVQIDLPPDLPLVRADANLLHHMLINLLDNAVRHGGGALHIAGLANGNDVELVIEDEGPGLAEESGATLTRFGRIAGSDRTGGAGLGFAIVTGFAEAMGVAVAASNRTDRSGARFALHFANTTPITGKDDAGCTT